MASPDDSVASHSISGNINLSISPIEVHGGLSTNKIVIKINFRNLYKRVVNYFRN